MNLTAIEEWVEEMGIPPGVQVHFSPVRDLLNWLQVGSVNKYYFSMLNTFQRLSSISEFSDLIATIQTMKSFNPLQVIW